MTIKCHRAMDWDLLYFKAKAFMTLFCMVSMLLSADISPDNLLTPDIVAELCKPLTREMDEAGVSVQISIISLIKGWVGLASLT